MSQFDPQVFLDATIDAPTEKREPLPPGEYLGIIGEISARSWQGKKDPTKSGIAWDVPVKVQVPMELQESVGGLKELTISDSVMLNLTENGTIDNGPGKNPRLRMYREACDLNKAGDSFSARKMMGAVVKVKVTHDLYEGNIYERIGGVAKAA